jgi:hypothetical protein
MNARKIPKFTAEASLSKGKGYYQSSAEATVDVGLVQPAADSSDEIDLDQHLPFLSGGLISTGNCRKRVCIHYRDFYPGVRVCDQYIWVRASCWP